MGPDGVETADAHDNRPHVPLQLLSRAKGTARDITTERLAQAGIQVRAAALESTQDAVIVVDSDGVITLTNIATEEMFGHTRSELIGSQVTKIMTSESEVDHSFGLKRTRDGEEPQILGKLIETSGLREDGCNFPIELRVSKIDGDTSSGFVGIIRDITKRKNLEEEARVRLAVLDGAADMVVIADPKGVIEYVN